jgi:hypothetical protein
MRRVRSAIVVGGWRAGRRPARASTSRPQAGERVYEPAAGRRACLRAGCRPASVATSRPQAGERAYEPAAGRRAPLKQYYCRPPKISVMVTSSQVEISTFDVWGGGEYEQAAGLRARLRAGRRPASASTSRPQAGERVYEPAVGRRALLRAGRGPASAPTSRPQAGERHSNSTTVGPLKY